MSVLNTQRYRDTRNVLSGKDGAFFDDEGNMLATVESFTAQVSNNNGNYQPLGAMQEMDIPQTYKVTLTVTAAVIESDKFIQEYLEALDQDTLPHWNFQGMIRGRNGSEERMNFRDCVPSGTVDLQNLTVGDLIRRNWNFTVNQPPKLQSLLTVS